MSLLRNFLTNRIIPFVPRKLGLSNNQLDFFMILVPMLISTIQGNYFDENDVENTQ
jgi:hypothetical protein